MIFKPYGHQRSYRHRISTSKPHDADSQSFIQINFVVDLSAVFGHQSFMHRHSETRRQSEFVVSTGFSQRPLHLRILHPSRDIAVLFNGDQTGTVPIPAVWIGNRDDPVPNNSTPLLTLGTRGELIITRDGGDPIQLYAGGSQRSNITATLLDTGNFLVQNMSSNGEELWQSYDHPTDTLLSGMKLGVNSKISSWLTPSNPASGPFTLEWDPRAGELLIRRRGIVYWRSGQLKDYYNDYLGNVKDFENFHSRPDPFNFNYNLTNEGDYFMYRVIQVAGMTPDSRKATSGWTLDWTGSISTIDDRVMIMAMASNCYGYNSDGSDYSRGCVLWKQPRCRNRHQMFDRRSGYFRHANTTPATQTFDNNSSLSLSDCRDACWNNCECAGYTNFIGEDYGCSYWIGKDLVWEQDFESSAERIYVLQSSGKGKKKYIGIVIGVVSAVLLLILGLAYLIMRNRKGKREEELHDLLTMEGYSGSYELENRGAYNHHLKLFTYASIMSATRKFSSNNKLGEGGFGPVYKGTTAEGQDIAVKLLSRQSGQGLLEFKNELILISELQHVNLVKL